MQKGLETRLIIHDILKILKNHKSTLDQILINKVDNNFSSSDRKMIMNVVLASMRYNFLVEKIIKEYSKKKINYNDNYFLLLSSITQLLILNFKDFAVINSTVEMAKLKKLNTSHKFINAILRNINRNKDKINFQTYNFDKLPKWFTLRSKDWSLRKKNDFMRTILKEPNIHLVFKNKESLNSFDFDIIKSSSQSAFLKKNISVKKIPDYDKGTWWVQDFSSMLPIYLIKKIKNKVAIDLCAAPGGKSFQLLKYGAKLESYEINKNRANIMIENLKRLKFDMNITIRDPLKINKKNHYDIILIDPPCSSIGTIRKNPEIFFRQSIPDLDKLKKIQKNLLEKAKKLLKKNGVIIYTVCSFLKEEGEDQITSFLKKNSNFNISKFDKKIDKEISKMISRKGFFYTAPFELENGLLIDGYFAAIIKKND